MIRRCRLWPGLGFMVCLWALPFPAIAGSLASLPNPLNFGLVSVNSAAASNFVEITNSGTDTQLTGFSKGAGCDEFSVQATTQLPAILVNGESMTVQVNYDPVDRTADSCQVTVLSTGSGGGFSVQGDGSASALNTLVSTLNFMPKHWNAGQVEVLYVSIENVGEESIGPANLAVFLSLGTQFSVGEVTGLPIGTGEMALIPVSFVPTSVGSKTDTLTIAVNNDSVLDSNDSVALSGTGTELPEPFFEDGFE